MKQRVVVFGYMGATILTNPPNLPDLLAKENALVNPDTSRVKDIPPQFWKKVGNEVHPMTEEEREHVLMTLAANGHAMPERIVKQSISHYASVDHVGAKVGEVEASVSAAVLNINDKILKLQDLIHQVDSSASAALKLQGIQMSELLESFKKKAIYAALLVIAICFAVRFF